MDELDKIIETEKLKNELIENIVKMKVTEETIYCILRRMFTEDYEKANSSQNGKKSEENILFMRRNRILILGVLCSSHKEEYVKCFRSLGSGTEHLVEDEKGEIVVWGKRYRKEHF